MLGGRVFMSPCVYQILSEFTCPFHPNRLHGLVFAIIVGLDSFPIRPEVYHTQNWTTLPKLRLLAILDVMAKTGKRGTCTKCGKGSRKLVNGICQHECVAKFNDKRRPDVDKSSKRQCHSCKQQEGSAGPALNWISCSNPMCTAWYHSACTEIGEIPQKAIDVVYWLCPECALSLKPTWVKIGDESSDRNEVAPVTLNQLSEMMTKLRGRGPW